MIKLYQTVLITLLLSIVSLQVKAQQDTSVLNTIISKIQEFDLSSPSEKVHIHFDKPYYAAADTIWLKTYVTQSQNQPTQLSKIVYVEMYNDTDSLMTQLKLPVIDGGAPGHIPLNIEKFKQGNYYIRAYTQWMLNFDPNYFFFKNIPIGEGVNKKVNTHVQYIKDKDGKISAKISFKDQANKIISTKSVNWQILSNFDVINKGKINTDMGGSAIIPIITDPKKDILGKIAQINASIDLGDGNKPLTTTIRIPSIIGNYDVQFFPEGGDLLINLPQQIAFKAINSMGLGVNITGKITDKNGNKLTDIKSSHLGMGSFYLNSEENNEYSAEIAFPDGTITKYKLPTAKKTGVTIQTSSIDKDAINVKLMATEDIIASQNSKNYYVVGQMNGVVYFSATIPMQKQVVVFKIPKTDLPLGLLQVTLFNDKSHAISERLIFVSKEKELKLAVKSDKPSYGIKQKVKLTLNANDSLKTAYTNVSLSVVDESKVPNDEENEITVLSTLLLTADLNGYIEKPNYYFTDVNESKLSKLDLLLLTQGYRRFEYKDILEDKYPEIRLLPEQGINITGTLRNKTGLPINKGTLLLTIPSIRYNKQLTTSTIGNFKFTDLVFPDSAEVVITARYNPNPNNLMMMIDGFPEAAIGQNKNYPDQIINIDSTISKYIDNNSKQFRFLQTIEQVDVVRTAAKKASHLDHPVLSTLPLMADDVLDASYIMPCNIITQCLRSKLVGVVYFEDNFYVARDFNAGSRIPMLIYLNNLMIDYAAMSTINPSEILNIQIFLRDPIGQLSKANNTNGVLVINTKPLGDGGTKMSLSDLKALLPESHTTKFKPKGYSVERKFYEPKYSVNPTELNFTDLRTTVYWNPRIAFDEKGQSVVEFFNADGKGNYKATLEGIDANGNVARTIFRYTVK